MKEIGLFLYYLAIEPWLSYQSHRLITNNKIKKYLFYIITMLKAWFSVGLMYFYLGALHTTFSQMVASQWLSWQVWALWISMIVMAGVYLFYYFFVPLILPRLTTEWYNKVAEMLKDVRYLVPHTVFEKMLWIGYAFNGVAEECLYRALIWPYLATYTGPLFALFLVACIDAWRYVLRGKKVIAHVFFTSLVFGLAYLVSHSLWLVCTIRFLHYFKALYYPIKRSSLSHTTELCHES